jgi:hypothetical protein
MRLHDIIENNSDLKKIGAEINNKYLKKDYSGYEGSLVAFGTTANGIVAYFTKKDDFMNSFPKEFKGFKVKKVVSGELSAGGPTLKEEMGLMGMDRVRKNFMSIVKGLKLPSADYDIGQKGEGSYVIYKKRKPFARIPTMKGMDKNYITSVLTGKFQ